MAQPNLEGISLPSFETWGCKRHLRCCITTLTSSTPLDVGGPHFLPEPDVRKPPPLPPFLDGFDEIRKKLEDHLRNAAEELDLTVPPQPNEPNGDDAIHLEGHPLPPMPRRPRRSANPHRRDPSTSPPSTPSPTTRSSRARSLAERAEKKQLRFLVTLSREKIDEDFNTFIGRRAPGKPKRRPPAVRKHVNMLFPGMGLSEVTAACYAVAPPLVRSRGG